MDYNLLSKDELIKELKILKESERRYKAILEVQNELICRYSKDGILTFVNSAYCNYFNKTKDELVGNSFYPMIHKDDKKLVDEKISSLSPLNPSITYSHRVIVNGEIRWQEWCDMAFFNEKDEVIEYQSVGKDITKKRLYELSLEKKVDTICQKLENTKEIYKEMFENIDLGVAIYKAVNDGEDFKFVGINKKGEYFSKVKKEEILGKRVTKLFPNIKKMGLFDVFVKVYKDGKGRYLNERKYEDERITQWVSNYVYKLSSSEIVAIFNDETEKKKLEDDLKSANEILIEKLHKEKYLKGILLTIKDINKLIMKEKNIETILQGSCDILIKNDDFSYVFAILIDSDNKIGKVFEARDNFDFSLDGCEDTEEFDYFKELISKYVQNRDFISEKLCFEESQYGYLCAVTTSKIVSNMRDREVIEELADDLSFGIYNSQIEKKTKELEFIIDNSPIIVFLWQNKEGWPVEFVSENISQFGYTPNDFYSSEVEYVNIVYEEDLSRIGKEVEYYSNNNFKEFRQEYRIYSKDRKKLFYIDDRTWIRRNKKGEITHYQGIVFDITKQKEAQDKLEEYKNNLEVRVIQEIERRREQEQLLIQQSKLASLGEMLGAIAHQWRQPLNAVALKVQFLLDLYEDGELKIEDLRDGVVAIMKQIYFMSHTIDDFRNFFKPTSASQIFDIKEILESSYQLLSAQLNYHNITFKLNVNNKKFLIKGNKNQFKQAILNILTNAKDAIDEFREKKLLNEEKEGIISIDLFKNEKEIILKVWDNGGIVSKEVLEKMFNPYFSTKEEGKGTGIGLYMSKIIIEKNLSGKIFAKNRDEGFEISMKFPIL